MGRVWPSDRVRGRSDALSLEFSNRRAWNVGTRPRCVPDASRTMSDGCSASVTFERDMPVHRCPLALLGSASQCRSHSFVHVVLVQKPLGTKGSSAGGTRRPGCVPSPSGRTGWPTPLKCPVQEPQGGTTWGSLLSSIGRRGAIHSIARPTAWLSSLSSGGQAHSSSIIRRFSSNSALSISPRAKRSFRISMAAELSRLLL
jgi:hypothetical protein